MIGRRKYSKSAVSNVVFAGVAIILLIIAGASLDLYYAYPKTTAVTSTITGSTVTTTETHQVTANASAVNEVSSLAYSHWASIGAKNISAIMSQYSQNSTLY